MIAKNKKRKKGNRKEMKITLKSKPKNLDSMSSIPFKSKSNNKPSDFRKKGTRGSSWIG